MLVRPTAVFAMPTFHYVAHDAAGQPRQGQLEARTSIDAVNQLRRQGLRIERLLGSDEFAASNPPAADAPQAPSPAVADSVWHTIIEPSDSDSQSDGEPSVRIELGRRGSGGARGTDRADHEISATSNPRPARFESRTSLAFDAPRRGGTVPAARARRNARRSTRRAKSSRPRAHQRINHPGGQKRTSRRNDGVVPAPRPSPDRFAAALPRQSALSDGALRLWRHRGARRPDLDRSRHRPRLSGWRRRETRTCGTHGNRISGHSQLWPADLGRTSGHRGRNSRCFCTRWAARCCFIDASREFRLSA